MVSISKIALKKQLDRCNQDKIIFLNFKVVLVSTILKKLDDIMDGLNYITLLLDIHIKKIGREGLQ